MNRSLALRLFLALAALLLLGGLLAFALGAFERLLGVWERALAVSPLLAGAFALLLLGFAVAAAMLLWWILRPPKSQARRRKPLTEDEVSERVVANREMGLDVSEVDAELQELARRRDGGELYLALYGEISAGKSSLIRALLPQAQVQTDVRGGTTRHIQRYAWQHSGGDTVYLADVPGFSDADAKSDNSIMENAARDEAIRAHLVVYLCDGDLTRDEWQQLDILLEYDKPVILAINKIDRLSASDLRSIRKHLTSQLANRPGVTVVAIQAGGEEQVLMARADGSEERQTRARTPQVDELVDAMQTQFEADPKVLATLRDTAVVKLAAVKLDTTLDAQRHERAQELVATYTRRAVLGAMAAVSPGSDLVIQGVLGTQLVRELCKLYDAEPRDLQIEKLLKSANRKIRRNSALVLAVVGNGFKAFPGIGTVTGGLMHAVAYGLLFDTLGRAMIHSLRTRGELRPERTAQVFETMLDEDLLPRARRLAALALKREPETR